MTRAPAPDLSTDPRGLAAWAARAHAVTVLTGAGVSTNSGVPDFRSPNSPWIIHKPLTYAEFLSSAALRAEAWRRKFATDHTYRGARPNDGHLALARAAASDRLLAVVTQNIDGLHADAGLPAEKLVELHGNGTFAQCLSCGQRHELADVRRHLESTGEAPLCRCGGFIKSATVAFGQPIPEAALARAVAATRSCDLFVAVGSSLVVRPAATLPRLARSCGAAVVLVNGTPTPLDAEADAVFRCDASAGLIALAEGLAEATP